MYPDIPLTMDEIAILRDSANKILLEEKERYETDFGYSIGKLDKIQDHDVRCVIAAILREAGSGPITYLILGMHERHE